VGQLAGERALCASPTFVSPQAALWLPLLSALCFLLAWSTVRAACCRSSVFIQCLCLLFSFSFWPVCDVLRGLSRARTSCAIAERQWRAPVESATRNSYARLLGTVCSERAAHCSKWHTLRTVRPLCPLCPIRTLCTQSTRTAHSPPQRRRRRTEPAELNQLAARLNSFRPFLCLFWLGFLSGLLALRVAREAANTRARLFHLAILRPQHLCLQLATEWAKKCAQN